MNTRLARIGVVLVVALALAAAVFRVVTAPERVQQRREIARTACLAAGGQWERVGRDEVCRRGGVLQPSGLPRP
jgi:hypothetical protein